MRGTFVLRQKYLSVNISYEANNNEVFSILPILRPNYAQISYLAPSAYLFP